MFTQASHHPRRQMKKLLFCAALLSTATDTARAQDVFLARISTDATGKPRVETPVNITSRPGYDNQPSFGAGARTVFYTSTREDQQADIYGYDIAAQRITRITQTAPESEYSATLMPAGNRFSVIRVERDSAQRLWSFALDGGDPQVVIPGVRPVGYHTWAGTAHVAMFVLGSPNTLQLYDTRNGRVDTITTDVGRSLATLPTSGGVAAAPGGTFSYVKLEEGAFSLYTVNSGERPLKSTLIAKLPAGSEFVAWLSPAKVITGQNSALLMYDATAGGGWTEIANLAGAGLTRISRLAIGSGAEGQWIAIVAEPATGGLR
jgi:hypothetical protein